jgi:hydrogenase maturation protease
MNIELVEKIANAVLYEGYMLYPYRPTAVKNRQRFNFGSLSPRAYSVAQQGTEAWSMQTECLVVGHQNAEFDVKVRFLHLTMREVCKIQEGAESTIKPVAMLEVDDQIFQTWQEAVEREVIAKTIKLSDLITQSQRTAFSFPPKQETEELRDSTGQLAGLIVRKRQAIEGSIEVEARHAADGLFKITARILNLTPMEEATEASRDEALMSALVSTHTILSVRDGQFVSLLDPPDEFRQIVASCNNVGTWPVLVGEEGDRDVMLSSPIILYDYPQIAPESSGDLFDGTEIDEILTLRIMTMTDEEKREMRSVDERARKILERTETLPAEQLMKMHGAVRGLRPVDKERR